MTSSADAAWLHLCPVSQTAEARLEAAVTHPDGTQSRLVVNDQSSLSGCQSLALPARPEQIDAVHPLSSALTPEEVILLQGNAKGDRFAISGTTFPSAKPAPPRPTPMPLHANLLQAMQARPFGAEERVQVKLAGGQLNLTCTAGSKPAGVLLSGPLYLPRADVSLQAEFAGSGYIELQVADAAQAAREAALPIGRMAAQDKPGTASFALPRGLDRHAWKHFVLVCPPQAAKLELNSLQLASGASTVSGRSAWVWQAPVWQQTPAPLLEWAKQYGMTELFIAVPLENGAVRDPAALAAFIRQAGERGIAVWSVDGDPHMVLPAEHKSTLQRARAYAAYNAKVNKSARLRGMQFDIEPYLLPGYELAVAEWDRRYLELARALRKASGAMRLEFVVPYWWAEKTAFLNALAPHADGLVVMNYRTDAREIYRFAVPFLDWADVFGKSVRLALEAGPVAAETQRRYVRAANNAPGELQLLEIEGTQVLVLFKEARKMADAQSYRLQNSIVLDGSATTFHASPTRMLELLPQLERDFSAWPEFSGMALHELPGQTQVKPK